MTSLPRVDLISGDRVEAPVAREWPSGDRFAAGADLVDRSGDRATAVPAVDAEPWTESDSPSAAAGSHGPIGREREGDLVRRLVVGSRVAGDARVISGAIGSGKSALLAHARSIAAVEGVRVMTWAVQREEADPPLAAVHDLVRRLQTTGGTSWRVDGSHGDPSVDGLGPGPAQVHAGAALVEVLAGAAHHAPVLLVVENAHWLTDDAAEALSFAARKVRSERVVVLVELSDDVATRDAFVGIEELRLVRLAPDEADRVVRECAPRLSRSLRSRVTHQARGNLATLRDLAVGVSEPGTSATSILGPWDWPVGQRFRLAFRRRMSDLPHEARRLILLASCEPGLDAGELVAAAGGSGTLAAERSRGLAAAIDSQIIAVDRNRVLFPHPAAPAAVYQASTPEARVAAHAAIAAAMATGTFRHAFHASMANASQEGLMDLLEASFASLSDGGTLEAVRGFDRVSLMSRDEGAAVRAALGGAMAAVELGWEDVAQTLAGRAAMSATDPTLKDLAVRTTRTLDSRSGALPLVEDLRAVAGTRHSSTLLRRALARSVLSVEWCRPPADPASRDRVATVLEADPVAPGGAADGETGLDDPDLLLLDALGSIRELRTYGAAGILAAAVTGFRSQRRDLMLAQALALRSWACIGATLLDEAVADATEAATLASTTGQAHFEARALAALATVAAIRGDDDGVQRLALAADRLSVPLRDAVVVADASIARGMSEIGRGCYVEGANSLALLFDRGMATSQQRLSVIGLLAEASVLAGKREQLARAIRLLEDEVPAPVLTRSAETTFARLLLADEGEEALRELLSGAHHESPFFQARVRLSLGMQLRRARRIVDAREPLGAAATGFEAICAEPWASRAREELRATGTQRRGGAGSASELTSQELLIAQMAAAGLSNKEIGRRLIVSPRTVGAHLYRTFPKLGVAARGELNHALAGYDSSIAS